MRELGRIVRLQIQRSSLKTGEKPRRRYDPAPLLAVDRKSTRLNSSHSQISYAVFCLKKKTTKPSALGNQPRTGGDDSLSWRIHMARHGCLRPCTAAGHSAVADDPRPTTCIISKLTRD